MRQKNAEQTLEDMNEWVDELHAEINNAKMVVEASVREAKEANDKLYKITSIACTQLALLKDLKLRLSETTDMLLYECHQQEAIERICTIHMDIKRERQVGRRGSSGKRPVCIVLLIYELLVNGTPSSSISTNTQTVYAVLNGTADCELPSVDFFRKFRVILQYVLL